MSREFNHLVDLSRVRRVHERLRGARRAGERGARASDAATFDEEG